MQPIKTSGFYWSPPTITAFNFPSGVNSGTTLELDVAAAIKAGVLKSPTPAPRQIIFEDLKVGDVFKFKGKHEVKWQDSRFKMVLPVTDDKGITNAITIVGAHNPRVSFGASDYTVFAILQVDGTWKETI